ncbi:DUF6049 family protein [Nocardioides insulae]|uniref:DUF6049 family protein n=1 Tax=Nocardioides insulae TaxID=394734 RepID=UPI000429A564|nr:DUF6049 family protein [Nocardioides insulae]
MALVLALLVAASFLAVPAPARATGTASTTASSAGSAAAPTAAPTRAASTASGAPAGNSAQQEEATPLSVTIGSISPSSVPQSGPLSLTGTVTNTDEEAWEDVRVYAFVGDTPMTSSAELAEAAATDPEAYVADRITSEGTYATLPRIEPGATVNYHLSIPHRDLPTTEGVYWFGTHALGDNDDPELGPRADGRARTFLTVIDRPAAREDVPTSFVIPLRRRVVRAEDGRVGQVSGWTRSLSAGGRLRELVDTALAAGTLPVDWLVDPAVLDAVHQLAAGNPPRDAVPATDEDGEDPPDDSTDGTSTAPSPSAAATPEDPEEAEALAQAAEAATDWLDLFDTARAGNGVLALPYGDPDLPAVAAHESELYDEARERGAALLAEWGITATPVDAPLGGYADKAALELGSPDTPMILSDRAFASAFGSVVPAAVQTDSRRVLTSSSGAAAGGPEPEPTDTGVPLRQRIIAEAGVRAITAAQGGDPVQPLLVSMPADWDPAESSGLFAGLEQPWLTVSAVGGALSLLPAETAPSQPAYPDSEKEAELSTGQLRDVVDLDTTGPTLQRVLSHEQIATRVRDEALTGASYQARDGRGGPTRRSLEYVEDQLGSIVVAANRVTLSSASGAFPVTVMNDLDQPVTVTLETSSDTGISVAPTDPVEVPGRGRTTVLLEAHAERNGLHTVSVAVTDTEGVQLGSTTTVAIRAAEVSAVIWVFLGVGAALLFGAIAVRLVRRVRRRSSDTPPEAHAGAAPGSDPQPVEPVDTSAVPDDPDPAETKPDQEHPRAEGPV